MSQTKERGILFSGPMVRAILDGRKTQTRRVVKEAWQYLPFDALAYRAEAVKKCPFGTVGDRLWVRETFALENCQETGWHEPPHKDGRPLQVHEADAHGDWPKYWVQPHYAATDPAPALSYDDKDEPCVRWRPSIFMPRWASRITLEITGVRVQRLQEISEEDAEAEAVPFLATDFTQRIGFERLWNSLNEKRGYGWDSNPWVWAITFQRITPAERSTNSPPDPEETA